MVKTETNFEDFNWNSIDFILVGPMPPFPAMNDETVDVEKLSKAVTAMIPKTHPGAAAYGLFTDVLDAVRFLLSYQNI